MNYVLITRKLWLLIKIIGQLNIKNNKNKKYLLNPKRHLYIPDLNVIRINIQSYN